ncbi:hypothetical protein [uncultured Rhodoblastus sp.]|uniref:hypothetical protein n=1 Tax=uncultured Rhodoblastus sp. TaxID=543037 RepID=UPI0025D9A525|nr:hypothetical protein [uncultured Rhodoblastus sp.]
MPPLPSSLAPWRRAPLAARLACVVLACFAAWSGTDAARGGSILLAQTGDRPPADAGQAEPPASRPASNAAGKTAPKPKPKAAQAKDKPPAPAPAPASSAPPAPIQPAPPAPLPVGAAEPQPLAHAAQAGVKACLDGLVRAANATIDAPHTAMSNWYTGAADSHVFESIVSLTYPNKVAPRAAVVLLGSPTSNHGCDTSYIQVFPTARPCNEIQGDLLKEGKVAANLSGLAVTVGGNGARQLLLPAPGNGCVIVVVGLTFGK